MPAIIALILRQVVMAVATSAIITGAQELLDGTIKELVFELKDKEGVTEQDAKDIIGNILVDLAVNSGSIMFVLRTGSGVKAAEYLGLTSRGFKKKVLTGKAVDTMVKINKNGGSNIAKSAIPKILKFIAIPGSIVWFVKALADIIEPGIYQPDQANAIYKKLGIPYQYPTESGALKPGPFGNSQFEGYAKAIESQNATGIFNPSLKYVLPYSRQALADLIDILYGKELLNGKSLSVVKMIPLIAPYIILGGTNASGVSESNKIIVSGVSESNNSNTGNTLFNYYKAKGQSLPSITERAKIYQDMGLGQSVYYTGTAEQNTKLLNALLGKGINNPTKEQITTGEKKSTSAQIITGVISNGVIKKEIDFVSRQDDLIEDEEELWQAINNNLAPFLLSINNKLKYELKSVASVRTSDGTYIKGTSTKIISGYTTKGVPKYKTVVNKFAILDVKIKPTTGAMVKIGSIILGPVNTLNFKLSDIDVSDLSANVQQNITAPIQQIVSTQTNTEQEQIQIDEKPKTTEELILYKVENDLASGIQAPKTATGETAQGTVDTDIPYSLARTTIAGMIGQYNQNVQEIQKEMVRRGFIVPTDGILTDAFLTQYHPVVNADSTAIQNIIGPSRFTEWRKLKTN